jgi:hypothetical protein
MCAEALARKGIADFNSNAAAKAQRAQRDECFASFML